MSDQNRSGAALVCGGVVCVIAPMIFYTVRVVIIGQLLAKSNGSNGSVTIDDPISTFKWASLGFGMLMVLLGVIVPRRNHSNEQPA